MHISYAFGGDSRMRDMFDPPEDSIWAVERRVDEHEGKLRTFASPHDCPLKRLIMNQHIVGVGGSVSDGRRRRQLLIR